MSDLLAALNAERYGTTHLWWPTPDKQQPTTRGDIWACVREADNDGLENVA